MSQTIKPDADPQPSVMLHDIGLTQEDLELRRVIRDYAVRELEPRAGQLDAKACFPADAVSEMADLGLFGLMVPEQHAGAAASRLQISLVLEELARADAATALTLMAHLHSSGLIARYGDDDQRGRWLPALASGERLAAVCLTEPDTGTDVAAIRSTARREGDHYVVDARKMFITNGGHADLLVVFARVGPWAADGGGISAFIVDARADGITTSAPFEKLGLRASSTTELRLDGVVVGRGDRLGEEGAGLRMALESLDGARMSTAAQAVGIGQGAFEIALGYARQREQSGKVIARHQAVQLRLAEMHVRLTAARALLYQVSRAVDVDPASRIADAAVAKVFCTATASLVAGQAVELLGGYGYMEEYRVARYMRDAKGGEIYDGTNDVNRLLIARQLLRAL